MEVFLDAIATLSVSSGGMLIIILVSLKSLRNLECVPVEDLEPFNEVF